MTDIVERLEDWAERERVFSGNAAALREAATEIRQLRALWNSDVFNGLRREADTLINYVRWLSESKSKLRADNARMREALERLDKLIWSVRDVDGDYFYRASDEAPEIIRRALSDAPQSDGWVSVAERLPDEGQRVDAWFDSGEYSGRVTGVLFQHGKFMIKRPKFITHWMPLPSAPKGGEV